jgi:hypothetical protein
VIFATNLAANFDPGFERRIRTHILFEMPDAAARERIWRVQVHPEKTPLAPDVDFRELAERFPVSGGDIQNAVLRAARIAAGQQGKDREKRIAQRHFVAAIERVLRGKDVMRQSLFADGDLAAGLVAAATEERLAAAEEEVRSVREELATLRAEMDERARRASLAWEERLRRSTLLPMPRWVSVGIGLLTLAASGALGWLSAAMHWIP